MIGRRHLLALLAASPAAAASLSAPTLANAFPGKRGMIVRRSLPPLLETPLAAFNNADLAAPVLTPTDRFFVRWHYPFPTDVDPAAHGISLAGHVARTQTLDMAALARLPQAEVTAINQCAGNGRALFSPRVTGAQWGNGAMGNAVWRGPRLADVLALAIPQPGALAVRASGLDTPPMDGAPPFAKSISLAHAMAGDVILATHMNGAPLPIVHGFPVRLVVPGWFSTYWVKMVDRLEVLAAPDTGHWMVNAYRVPDSADPAKTRAITAMPPRSLITSHAPGTRHRWAEAIPVHGVAMGGDTSVRSVEVSFDAARSWVPAALGPDHGPHSFRRFTAIITPPPGAATLLARTTNIRGESQPLAPGWNPGGFARNVAELVPVEFV